MDNDPKHNIDAETILMTLDQIVQTIDVMNNVVERLRCHIVSQVEGDIECSDTESAQETDTTPLAVPAQTIH